MLWNEKKIVIGSRLQSDFKEVYKRKYHFVQQKLQLMRKLILNLAVTLDGFIEGPNGEYDWCFTDQDYGMTDFLKRTDAIFLGRKSYEVLLRTDPNPYPDKTKYVFSKTLKLVKENAILVGGDIERTIKRIKSESGKDIWLFGGASLTASLLRARLIDEMMLAVHPILLGREKPLWADIDKKIDLKLADARTYSSGLVQLIYRV